MQTRTTTSPGPGALVAAALAWADRAATSAAAAVLTGALADLTDLLLPSVCAVCAQEPGTLCPPCSTELRTALLHPYRAEDGAAALPLQGDGLTPLPVVSAAHYGGAVSGAILAFKDHGRMGLAGVLRPALRRALSAAPSLVPELLPHRHLTGQRNESAPVVLVPIPGRAAGFRTRGYDPLGEVLVGGLPGGWCLRPDLLTHRQRLRWPAAALGRLAGPLGVTDGASHAGSTVSSRRRQGHDRFRPTSSLLRLAPTLAAGTRSEGAPQVVLVDDVMTTGTTLAAAGRALESVGIRPTAAVVLAAVSPPADQDEHGLDTV